MNTLHIPAPQAPCQTCIENAQGNDQISIAWCGHRRYGGVYIVELGSWSISGPFDAESEFRRSLGVTLTHMLAKH